MTAVFSHGRLRLYLLKLLADSPRHGYELIRLLENQFLGLYAPSAGTIYPRLQRMEAEGLVTHTASGGRKVYQITDAGRAELRQRAGELAGLEAEIHASVADLSSLANEIQDEVRGSVRDIKRELREQARQARTRREASDGPADHIRSWAWAMPSPGRVPHEPAGQAPRGSAGEAAGGPAGGAAGAGRGEGAGTTGDQPPDPRAAVLEERLGELLVEIRRLAGRPGSGEPTLRAATAALDAALIILRRL